MNDPLRYSIVVPVYNEVESVGDLHAEVVDVLSRMGDPFEVLYVDDGSTDGSGARLDELAASDPRVRAIHLVRNLGKSAAYMAGFEVVRGERVVTLDADLQDDPHEIPKLVERLESGFDLVIGWKQGRMDNEPLKAMPSRWFNRLVSGIFGLKLHDFNCGFRVMRRQVAASLALYGDLYRFIPQLAHVKGFRVAEEGVHHRKRTAGHSKYGVKRFWTGLLDVLTVRFITVYAARPLHFFGTLALPPLLIGGGLEVYVLVQKAAGDEFRTHMAAMLVGVLLLVMGVQCVVTGLIGEMLTAGRHQRMSRARGERD